ncbi:FAD-dependent oxidoreductase [Lusitaniella coriacea]|uniref:FAD-dependent oxidoreductase n=1 Tax=Lusitaniella coriacea TaxID=1983105 RepID=UPI003CF9D095
MNPQNNLSHNSHAIVIGGSMTGLLTARILINHYNRVTIIERDRLPDQPIYRPGVPQSRQGHVLLERGRAILEELFPGFQEEIVARGAHPLDMAEDLAWLTPFGWGIRFDLNVIMLSCSRFFLEWNVRRRLNAFPQIKFQQGSEVKGLLMDAEGVLVTGARVRTGEEEKPLFADLVVDASGRNSKAPQWLEQLGYLPPQETIVTAHIGYASRVYEFPEGLDADWKGFLVQTLPPYQPRGGFLLPIEGNRWLVTLGGGDGDYPPGDEEAFLEFIRTLPTPVMYDAIQKAKARSPIYCYRGTQNHLRQYDRLSQLPDGFVALGDSVCAFNPIYGQGMTAAALSALLLDRTLKTWQKDSLWGFSLHFQKKLAKENAPLWEMATTEDCRYQTVVGMSPTPSVRFMHGYMDRVVALTTESVFVRQTLLNVFNLLTPAIALFHPKILLRVLKKVLLGGVRDRAKASKPLPSQFKLQNHA